MIHVLATITLAPGTRARWLEVFHRLMPLVHAEVGCIEYGPAVDVPTGLSAQGRVNEDEVVVIEKWESLDHLKAHGVAPHMAEYREQVKEMVVGVKLRVLSPA